jgi:enoyl-CoA hydratase/carnithine racemase
MIQQLASALDSLLIEDSRISEERPVCLVLRGDTKYFCSGLDFSLAQNVINTPQRGGLMLDFMTDALNRIRQSDLVSVCSVNGPALGGGSELVTCCDYRLIASDSYIQFVHARLGAAPGWGGAHRLFNIVGRRHALRYLGSSQKIEPAEALSVGLCDEIIPVTAVASGAEGPHSSGDDDLRNKSLQDAAVRFLKPFTDQKYPGSVHAVKCVIASGECQQDREEEMEEEITLGKGTSIVDESASLMRRWKERPSLDDGSVRTI